MSLKKFLKEKLGEHYTEELDKEFGAELAKYTVPKDVYSTAQEKITALEEQVAERAKDLEDMKGSLGSIDEMTTKIADLEAKVAKADTDYKALEDKHAQEIADRDFGTALDTVLAAEKAKDVKSVRAHLDMDALRASKNQSEDIKAAIAKVRESAEYLFESDQPADNAVASTKKEVPQGSAGDALRRIAMGLPPEKGE
jgi:DNA repair exonuclease SbcCD ATPase subunit